MPNSRELQQSGHDEINTSTTVFVASGDSAHMTGQSCRRYPYADWHTVLMCADVVTIIVVIIIIVVVAIIAIRCVHYRDTEKC